VNERFGNRSDAKSLPDKGVRGLSTPAASGVLEQIYRQRACRAYRNDAVPDTDLVAIIKAASHAPSAENSQPWVFVVVDDPTVRAAIDELTRTLWVTGGRPHSERTLAAGFFADVDRFVDAGYGGAPCLIVAAADGRDGARRETLAASVYPAIQNLLLAASALDYGSSMTTMAALAPDELSSILGLPERVTPVAVIPIGRRVDRVGPPRRRPVDQIAHRNHFGISFPGYLREPGLAE
jgi:nitroreductase